MKYLSLILSTVILFSCSPKADDHQKRAEKVLESAGKNKKELQKVINHYTAQEDTEGLAAAYYLIANMPGQYTRTTEQGNIFRKHLKEIASLHDPYGWIFESSLSNKYIDSMLNLREYESAVFVNNADCEHITSDFLIYNIDHALNQWRSSPWGKDYDFEQFCKYILPYRIAHEDLEEWRHMALKDKIAEEDSLFMANDMESLAGRLYGKKILSYTPAMVKYPLNLTLSDLQLVRKGMCGQIASYMVMMYRARAIPSTKDVMPAWANRSSMHAWPAVITPNGGQIVVGYNTIPFKAPKIYRETDYVDKSSLLYKYKDKENIPEFFSEFNLTDVTADYDFEVADVIIDNMRLAKTKLVWLSVFDNFNWQPVAYAEIKNGKAKFQSMGKGLPLSEDAVKYMDDGRGILYLPTYFIDKKMAIASDPFILYETGQKRIIKTDSEATETIKLRRKYPKDPDFANFEQLLVGCRIEGASRSDFSDAKVLYTISEPQKLPIERIEIDNDRVFRYTRIRSHEDSSTLYIAELRLFNDDRKLSGTIICDENRNNDGIEFIFDGNRLSFYGGLGVDARLDFGKPEKITAMEFCSRTDDNEILPGNSYELTFWQDGWQSMGRKTATSYSLEWEEVPCGALLLLKNVTHGIEHRPFTYENGRQIWW